MIVRSSWVKNDGKRFCRYGLRHWDVSKGKRIRVCITDKPTFGASRVEAHRVPWDLRRKLQPDRFNYDLPRRERFKLDNRFVWWWPEIEY